MTKTRDDIIAEASRWVVEQRSGTMTAGQRAALRAWLDEHPDHQTAFGEIAGIASSAAALRSLADLEPRPALPGAVPSRHSRAWAQVAGSPRRRIVATAIAASLAGTVLLLPALPWRGGTEISTTVAETRTLLLGDGTRVTLGPESLIRADVDGGGRHAEIVHGEAFFEVAHDAARPFTVDAGDTTVRVLGTRFDVRRTGGRVSTSVLDGVVQVSEAPPLFHAKPRHVLRAYQRVDTRADVALFDQASQAAVVRADAPPGEWREGRLTYVDAALADVVTDLNRYYPPGISVDDAQLAKARIATTFTRKDFETFFGNLPIILPVEIRRSATGHVTIGRRPGA